MTDVSQDAREAQAALYEQMGKPGMAEEIRSGEQDDHPGVQAFSGFEAHIRSTIAARDTEAMRLLNEARDLLRASQFNLRIDMAARHYHERVEAFLPRIDTLTSAAQTV